MYDGHALILIDNLIGRKSIIDIRKFETEQYPVTRTDRVLYKLSTGTTDDVLDALTVTQLKHPTNKVQITSGRVQWYDWVFDITGPIDSPPLKHFGLVLNEYRWAMLCVFKNSLNQPEFRWNYGEPNQGYPLIPHKGVPIALVKQVSGPRVEIKSDHIINLRSVKAMYAPAGYFSYPPVAIPEDLEKYTEVVDGSTAFVIEDGVWYFYRNGIWSKQGSLTFDNTFYSKDIMEETSRVDIPWKIKSSAELQVHRDGLTMDPSNDYNVFIGAAPYIMFNYLLYPHQRITMIRNPFFGIDDDEVSKEFKTNLKIYVDGDIGHDAFAGDALHPFKTLQAAFDAIPIQSNFIVEIFAKNLKYIDRQINNEYGRKSYGILKHKHMRRLTIFIDDGCEWGPDIEYIFVCVDSTFISFGEVVPKYKFRLDNCISLFDNSNFKQDTNIVISGGTSFINHASSEQDSSMLITGGCSALIQDGHLNSLMVSHGGYASVIRTECKDITVYDTGIGEFRNITLINALHSVGSTVVLADCDIKKEAVGDFYNSKILASGLNFKGTLTSLSKLFFNIQSNSSLDISGSTFELTESSAIKLYGNSSCRVRDCTIKFARSDGISVENSSSLDIKDSEITGCMGNGISLTKGSSGNIAVVKGHTNSFYGIKCTKYSTMQRDMPYLTLTGILGPYIEVVDGSDTVAATATDLFPSHLIDKIKAGPGIKAEEFPTGTPDDFKVKISLNPSDLFDPNSAFGGQFNFMPKTSVKTHNLEILPNGIFDLETPFIGEGYISSVNQRSTILDTYNKNVPTNEITEKDFVVEDNVLGTDFFSNGVSLKLRPGLGYHKDVPFFFYSTWTSFTGLQSYVLKSINGLSITADMPSGTEIRVGFSFNGGRQWYRYTGGEWEALPGNSTKAQLNNAHMYNVVSSYPTIAWEKLRIKSMGYIDIGFSLKTNSTLITPTIYNYTWNLTSSGFSKDITHLFERTYYPSRTMFKNISGTTLQPPLVFTVFPLSNRT